MTRQGDRIGSSVGVDGADGLDRLADALLTYLNEVQNAADICRRHQALTVVHATRRCLTTTQRFQATQKLYEHLKKAAVTLPPWEESPWSKMQLRRWEQLGRAVSTRAEMCTLQLRGVAWEEHPVLIHAVTSRSPDVVDIVLRLPAVPADLPELPSFTLARALRCHEHLVPDVVARPLSIGMDGGSASLTVPDFLKRTMPRNLYASQCFFAPGAGS